jgi:uncharacterized membrane protein
MPHEHRSRAGAHLGAQHHEQGHGAGTRLTSRTTRWALGGLVVAVLAAALLGAVLLRPHRGRPVLAKELGFSGELVHATVETVDQGPCQGTEVSDGIRCDMVAIDVTSGPTKDDEGVFELPLTDATVRLAKGDHIVVQYQPGNPEDLRYFFQDYQRGHPMLLLLLLFAGAVIALGRWQGLRALAALAVSGVVLVAFAFPSILDGHDPTAVALVAAVVIAVAALYLTHGINDMMTVALVGTFAALGVTAVLAGVFTHLAHFTGFGSEDAFYLQYASAKIDVRGLILAGIIIGSLGVLDDVTVTQASAVWQLHEANPRYSARRLYAAAVKIGRDHIASTVNTLVLAYAGASLPLLLLFAQAGRSLTEVAVGELVAVEVVRTLVGSIGLVSTVPLTTALAALVVTRGPAGPPAPLSEGPAEPVSWARFAPPDRPSW